MQFATRLFIFISTLSSVIENEVVLSGTRLIFADVMFYSMNQKCLTFQTDVHNGYGEIVSAVQTLGLQESWEDSCSEKNAFQGLADHLSPPSRTKTLSL